MIKKEKKFGVYGAQVPISAMIDVVFLLLVYFIFTSKNVVDEVTVAINLPTSIPGPPSDQPRFDIYVHSGHYEFKGVKYSLSEISDILKRYGASFPDSIIDIKISIKATHEKLVLLMDSIKGAGLNQFNLHTLKASSSL